MTTQEQKYVRGFNHGYLLTKHLPELVAKLIRDIKETASDYMSGFFSGKEEYELEASRERLQSLQQLRSRSQKRDKGYNKEL